MRRLFRQSELSRDMAHKIIMIPICRNPQETDKVVEVMEEHGIKKGKHDLQVFVMAEIRSNVI
jgi:pyruvate,water dikinase